MDVPYWSQAEIQDFARGHEITYVGENRVDWPFPAWLDEVVSGRSPYSPTGAMAIAYHDDHPVMIASFLRVAEGHGVIQATSFRCNIDGTWRRMIVRSLNLFEQADIGALISTYVIADLADDEIPESITRVDDHDSANWLLLRLDSRGMVSDVEGKSIEIAGRTAAEMIGRRITDFVDARNASDSVPMWFSLLSDGPGATRSARRRYLHPDGTGVWTEAAYLNRFEPDGSGYMLMLAFDITERRAQEVALQERTEEVARLADESRRLAEDFRLLADESPAAVFRCDDQGRVTFHNARWTDLLGIDDDVIHLRGIVHPDVSSDLDRELAAALADTASEPRSFELRAASDDRILAFRCRSIADVDPARRRIVGSVEDVTDTVRLRAEASHDPLTGLINRAAIDQALTSALHIDAAGMVVLFVDLDGFKEVNDEFGHDAGDIVLKEFAARLSSAFRPEDVVGRYGGDEFVVLCRNVEPARATALMRRLDQALVGPIHFAGGQWAASASVGAARPEPGDDLKSVMRRADQAMFEEKRQRNGARAVR